MVLVLKNKLSKGTLTIEQAKKILDVKFEAMKEKMARMRKRRTSIGCLKIPIYTTFREKCGYCGKFAINHIAIQNKKRRILVVFSNLQNR